LPKSWREKWGRKVVLIELDDRIVLLPKRKSNLSHFFDVVEADIREDVEKELLEDLV